MKRKSIVFLIVMLLVFSFSAVAFAEDLIVEDKDSDLGNELSEVLDLDLFSVEPSANITWFFPMVDYTITQGYHSGHPAIDFVSSNTRIYSSAAGKVIDCANNGAWNGGQGNYVVVLHDKKINGYNVLTRYLHMSSITVSVGSRVDEHTVIGYMGDTGDSYGAHLHFDFALSSYTYWDNSKRVNPLTYLGSNAGGSCTTHVVGTYLWYDSTHPHYKYYSCSNCGATFTKYEEVVLSNCEKCKPGKSSFKNLVRTALVDEPITFEWYSTTRTTHYNLYIQKKDSSGTYVKYDTTHYAESGITKKFPKGEYRVCVQSTNSNADWIYTDSDWNYFSVVEMKKPGKSSIYNLKSVYYSDEKVDFDWTPAENVSWYDVAWEEKDSTGTYGNCLYNSFDADETNFGKRTFDVGEYRVKVIALGEWGSIDSNYVTSSDWYYFSVIERPVTNTTKFTDVKSGAYYYDAVAWAVFKKVTSGTSATTFSPDMVCTRGQAVTFLWRAAGSPEPKSSYNPFSDVKNNAYYYKAVLWAVENNITTGTGATTFSPDMVCSRSQIVTFLYRAEGQPNVTVRDTFSDVPANAYYAKAVSWAVDNKVTTGTSATTFSPNMDCSRGQIVTFLYRAKN